MHYVLGIFLRDSDYEIIEDDSPGKGSYAGLLVSMNEGRKMIRENPNIKQINIYQVVQGQRILSHHLFPEVGAGSG